MSTPIPACPPGPGVVRDGLLGWHGWTDADADDLDAALAAHPGHASSVSVTTARPIGAHPATVRVTVRAHAASEMAQRDDPIARVSLSRRDALRLAMQLKSAALKLPDVTS